MYISTPEYERPMKDCEARVTPSQIVRTEPQDISGEYSTSENNEHTFDHSIDTSKEGRLNAVETELCDNQLALVSELRCVSMQVRTTRRPLTEFTMFLKWVIR